MTAKIFSTMPILTEELKKNLDKIPISDRPMRRGAYTMVLEEGSTLRDIYGTVKYRNDITIAASSTPPILRRSPRRVAFSGMSSDGHWVYAFEWPHHPFCHRMSFPNLNCKSRPTRPHPFVSRSFVEKAIERKRSKEDISWATP